MESPLTQEQFDILTCLEKENAERNRGSIAQLCAMNEPSADASVRTMEELGLLHCGRITDAGREALEPYRVRRAVVIAAGFHHQLSQVTLRTPKPLLVIGGRRIIDRQLDALLAAGIREIYVVRGYLKEQFDQLLEAYPMIQFINNPSYHESNNISSVMCARHLLQGAYVMESDLLLNRPALITKYQYASNYLAAPTRKTNSRCPVVENGRIVDVKAGGQNCQRLYGISYWSAEDGARLCRDIKAVYDLPDGRNCYWDEVPLRYCREFYRVGVRPCSESDFAVIDTLSDLRRLDQDYL